MSTFPQNIEVARRIVREQGEDPDQYRFSMARNIGDVYFSSGTNAMYRVIVNKLNGGEQFYDMVEENDAWISEFERDLRTSRFDQGPESTLSKQIN
jgi:hypothetical protein